MHPEDLPWCPQTESRTVLDVCRAHIKIPLEFSNDGSSSDAVDHGYIFKAQEQRTTLSNHTLKKQRRANKFQTETNLQVQVWGKSQRLDRRHRVKFTPPKKMDEVPTFCGAARSRRVPVVV